ncbi:GNAT family N-acetyltransferase [Streptomyces sp. NPDC059009]|uniref:GNAT family N-acetyltransferase n=1 Tax=Streptomyces sp. NPDC059009 TaxID=3346694 RepID=UPI00367B106A
MASRSPARVRPTPIRTGRLYLEPLRTEHAEDMAVVLADPALHTFIGGAPDPAPALRARYTRMLAGCPDPDISWCNWVIRLSPEDGDEARLPAEPAHLPTESAHPPAGAGHLPPEAGQLVGTVQATVGPAAHLGLGPGTVAEIAWVVGTDWQGRGIASEAARSLVDWLDHQGVPLVVAYIHPDHAASAAVARAAGLTPTDDWQDDEVCWRRPPSTTPDTRHADPSDNRSG